jgi:hypothetical protein
LPQNVAAAVTRAARRNGRAQEGSP